MTLQSSPRPAWLTRKSRLEFLLVAILYFILILGAVYPAPKYWNTQMIGGSWDSGLTIWNFWWVDTSVQNLHFFPFFTKMLYYPVGVSLAYHNLALYNAYQATFFHHVIGINLPAAYNTIAVIAFLIGAIGMYTLVKHLTQSSLAGFIAGIIFSFSPVHVSRLHFGHLEIFTAAQFIPFVALSVIKSIETRQWRFLVLGSFLISAIGWQSLDIARGTLILASIIFLFWNHKKNSKRWVLIRWLILLCLVCILLCPVAFPILRDFTQFKDQVDQNAASIANSPDLLNFFLPDRSISAFWRAILTGPNNYIQTGFYQIIGQKTIFLGISVIALGILSACLVSIKQTRKWWGIAFIFFILSLGPILKINGTTIFAYMPYKIFSYLPIIGLGREPARFGIFLVLAIAVLVGYFISKIDNEAIRNKILIIIMIPAIYLELLAVPVQMDDRLITMPSYYHEIALLASSQNGGVLDIPYDLYGAFGPACDYMVYQTVHQRPIVSGYISRAPHSAIHMLDHYPFIRQFRARLYGDTEPVLFKDALTSRGFDELHKLKIEFVILHKTKLPVPDTQQMINALNKAIGTPIHEDSWITVWQIPH